MLKKLSLLLSICFLILKSSLAAYSLEGQTLVTIHGFLGAPWNMFYLSAPYEDKGIKVINWGYPSREKKIEEHAADLVKELQAIAQQQPGIPMHFLTHSMGGLVLRAALNHPDCPTEAKIGRAVLLAPPNQGACWGRFLEHFPLAHDIGLDESGKQLMTEFNFEHLGEFPDTLRVLVIAGNSSLNPLIPGENDGTVAVEETFLTTPHQHFVIKAGHKSILISKKAASLAKAFFEED